MALKLVSNGTLDSETVRKTVIERLRPLFQKISAGYRLDRDMALNTVVYAATQGQSLHAACAALTHTVDDNTLRDALNAAFPANSVRTLEQQVNGLLLADLPDEVRAGRRDIAIDLHDVPYYGRVAELDGWICRGKARSGTTHFVRIATAYLMLDGLRINLAVRFVRPTFELADVVSTLLVGLRRTGLRVCCVWLDRGFASVAVIQRLQSLRLPAIIACPIRGQDGGTRALCRGRVSYTTSYTMNSQYSSCTVRMAVVRGYVHNRGQSKRARWFLYIQVGLAWTPQQVHSQYRRRFGIESSYRCLGQVRPRTTSRNPALRFLWLSIGLLLVNAWTLLRYKYCRVRLPARGFRRQPVMREVRNLFRLDRMRSFLRHAIEAIYGFLDSIPINHVPATFGNY
jgi:putative transposase